MQAFRLGVAAVLVVGSATTAARADDAGSTTFERHVRPIFKAYCLDCHGGGAELKGKLDLRLARTARRGGKRGPALVPGKPEESVLLDRIREGEMPPGEKKVPPAQVAIIERWIAQGARTLRDEPESLPPGIDITPEERAFWAFQPVRRPEPPAIRPDESARVRTPDRRLPPGGAAPTRARRSRPRPIGSRCCAARRSTSRGCRRRPSWSTRSSPIGGRMPMSGRSTACSIRRITASAGRGTGSTSPATPIPTATATTTPRVPTPTSTATT